MLLELLTVACLSLLFGELPQAPGANKALIADEELLFENFDSTIQIMEGNPSNMGPTWITSSGQGDTPSEEGWFQSFDGGFHGPGYMKVSSTNMFEECIPKVKILSTPTLNWEAGGRIRIEVWERIDEGGLGRIPDFFVTSSGPNGELVKTAAVSSKIAARIGPWIQFQIDIQVGSDTFRVSRTFVSNPGNNQCDGLSVDEFRIIGLCDDEPDTLITEPGPEGQPIVLSRGSTVTLSGMAVGPNAAGSNLAWQVLIFGDPIDEGFGSNFTYTFLESGDYEIRCAATNGCGATDSTPDVRSYQIQDCTLALPATVITSPPETGGVYYYEVDEQIVMTADLAAPSQETLTFHWELRTAEGAFQTGAEGQQFSVRIAQAGEYVITCVARNNCGGESTVPARRELVIVADPDLDTVITSPADDHITLVAGSSRQFSAMATAAKTAETSFSWRRKLENADSAEAGFQGANVTIDFPEPGFYTITCSARRQGFKDPTPALVTVQAVEASVRITSPEISGRRINISSGTQINFQGLVEDPAGLVASPDWVMEPGGQVICSNSTSCSINFPEKGRFAVVFGKGAYRDIVRVDVDAQLIVDAWFEDEFGERSNEAATLRRFSLKGVVSGPLANDPALKSVWLLNGIELNPDDDITPDFNASGLRFPGFYQARLLVMHPDAETIETRINFQIYDASQAPDAEIISPVTDLSVPPGKTVFFDSSYRNTRLSRRNAEWEICLPDGTLFKTGSGATLGRVKFDDLGVYTAKLFLFEDRGSFLVDTRTINVGRPTLDQGSTIGFGDYGDQPLSSDNRFKVNVPRDGQTLRLETEIDVPSSFELLDENGAVVFGPVQLDAGRSVVKVGSLPAGLYTIRLKPQDAGKVGSFSFGVNTINPALYLAGITENGGFSSNIGIVNPNGSEADVTIYGYDLQGNKLNSTLSTFQIPGQGSFKDNVFDLFPDATNDLAWIRVDSTLQLTGYSQTISVANREAYAVSGATYLERRVYVPHIAKDTGFWYTRANVVNGKDQTIDASLETADASSALNNKNSFSQDSFDFLEKFPGGIPQNSNYGFFEEGSGEDVLTGNEIFGTLATDQVVGLGLSGAPADNPNFTTTPESIYFTHIANPTQFWTALALVNLENAALDVGVIAYGAGGTVLGSGSLGLAANEKLAVTFTDFFPMVTWDDPDDAAEVADAQWVEVQTVNANITGYELFGDSRNNKLMAGLEAITDVKQRICMPFVDGSGNYTHGISVVNVTDNAATVTFRLYDDVGAVLQEETRNLTGKEKQIYQLELLFPSLPMTSSWLEVDADREVVGFELFISHPNNEEHMSGLIAR